MSVEQRRRQQFIAGLRAVASFYEQNADAYYDGMHVTLNCMYGVARHAVRCTKWSGHLVSAPSSTMTVTLLFPGSSVSS